MSLAPKTGLKWHLYTSDIFLNGMINNIQSVINNYVINATFLSWKNSKQFPIENLVRSYEEDENVNKW